MVYFFCDTHRLTAVVAAVTAATAVAAAADLVYEYVPAERCTPSALLFVSRPETSAADCSLATERCAARRLHVGRDATSLSSCVTIQLIDRSAAACSRG